MHGPCRRHRPSTPQRTVGAYRASRWRASPPKEDDGRGRGGFLRTTLPWTVFRIVVAGYDWQAAMWFSALGCKKKEPRPLRG
eukprot:10688920-Alexandrium_andersonii.AAC.1